MDECKALIVGGAMDSGKYYAVGCKFNVDAAAMSKRLAALEKALVVASAGYDKWAKDLKPLSLAIANHWADTTEMPTEAKESLKEIATAGAGAAAAHRAYAASVLDEFCGDGRASVALTKMIE